MQKNFLIFALVGAMIMSLSAASMASNAYVAGVVGGTWENNITNEDDDLDFGFIVGGEYNFLDKFKVGLEYLSGAQKDADGDDDLDYDSYEVKFGYRVLQNDRFNMDVTLGYYDESYDNSADTEIDGIILGADLAYIINDKFSVSGSLGFSVDGSIDTAEAYDDNDVDILMAKVQGNYNITDQWSAFLGSRYIISDIDKADEITNQSVTLGAAYNF